MKKNPWKIFHERAGYDPQVLRGDLKFTLKFIGQAQEDAVTVDLTQEIPTCEYGISDSSDIVVEMRQETLPILLSNPDKIAELYELSGEIVIDTKEKDFVREVAPALLKFIYTLRSLEAGSDISKEAPLYLDPRSQLIKFGNGVYLAKGSKGIALFKDAECNGLLNVLAKSDEGISLQQLPTEKHEDIRRLLNSGFLLESLEVESVPNSEIVNTAPLCGSNLNAKKIAVLSSGYLGNLIANKFIRAGHTVQVIVMSEGEYPTHRENAEIIELHQKSKRDLNKNTDSCCKSKYTNCISDVDLVVSALEHTSYSYIENLASVATALDKPFLPVTVFRESIEVGPTLLSGAERNFYLTRFEKELSAAAGLEAGLPLMCSNHVTDRLKVLAEQVSDALVDNARKSIDVLLLKMVRYPLAKMNQSQDEVKPETVALEKGGLYVNTPRYSDHTLSAILSLESYLNPDIFKNTQHLKKIKDALADNRAVVIRNAFKTEFAEVVHEGLEEVIHWPCLENYITPGFTKRQHALSADDRLNDKLAVAKMIFTNLASRKFMQALASIEANGKPDFHASFHQPGDYAAPHTDFQPSRRISWIWYLTKYWDERWGGDFHWTPTDVRLPPEFNTLCMFRVTPNSTHSVLPVTPLAKSRRYTVNGWYYSDGKNLYGSESKTLSDEDVLVL